MIAPRVKELLSDPLADLFQLRHFQAVFSLCSGHYKYAKSPTLRLRKLSSCHFFRSKMIVNINNMYSMHYGCSILLEIGFVCPQLFASSVSSDLQFSCIITRTSETGLTFYSLTPPNLRFLYLYHLLLSCSQCFL